MNSQCIEGCGYILLYRGGFTRSIIGIMTVGQSIGSTMVEVKFMG